MDVVKGKWKKNLISKAWKQCRSLGNTGSGSSSSSSITTSCLIKSQLRRCSTAPSERKQQKCQVAPKGCFSVYVGPEKQRFVVRTEFANHPLFKLLLEDAEMEYGFNSEGPILLPCDVDLFYNVLAEMESCEVVTAPNWRLMLRSPCSPKYSRVNNTTSYKLLSPSGLLKINHITDL